jgi:hypothetical protein
VLVGACMGVGKQKWRIWSSHAVKNGRAEG